LLTKWSSLSYVGSERVAECSPFHTFGNGISFLNAQ